MILIGAPWGSEGFSQDLQGAQLRWGPIGFIQGCSDCISLYTELSPKISSTMPCAKQCSPLLLWNVQIRLMLIPTNHLQHFPIGEASEMTNLSGGIVARPPGLLVKLKMDLETSLSLMREINKTGLLDGVVAHTQEQGKVNRCDFEASLVSIKKIQDSQERIERLCLKIKTKAKQTKKQISVMRRTRITKQLNLNSTWSYFQIQTCLPREWIEVSTVTNACHAEVRVHILCQIKWLWH